jgi:uncharacterized membrane protein
MRRELPQGTFPLWLFAGFLFIAMSIPLILNKVPPNAWYGFRVAKTYASERIWYVANREAGYNLLYAGITIAVTAVVTKLLVSKYGLSNNIFNSVNLVIFIFALVVTTARSFLTLNQL